MRAAAAFLALIGVVVLISLAGSTRYRDVTKQSPTRKEHP